MLVARVVLAQEILAVVVAVRRTYYGVDVLPGRPIDSRQCDGRLVIELDQNDRAVDSIVENAVGPVLADPAEVSLVEIREHLLHPDLRVPRVHVADVLGYQLCQKCALLRVQF